MAIDPITKANDPDQNPHLRTCQAPACGVKVRLIPTDRAGVLMPVDAEPNEAGNIVLRWSQSRRRQEAHTLTRHEKENPSLMVEVRYMPHFATCTDPTQFRKRKP